MTRVKWVNIVFFATVIVSVVGGIASQEIYKYFDNNYFARILSYQAFLILPAAFYIAYFRLNIKETIRFHKISFSNVVLLVLFAYLISPLMALLNSISMLFAKNTISTEITNVVSSNYLILSLFLVAFIPCIFEESVYRGVFYNEYRKIDAKKGILLSALLFGLLHMNFNQFFYAFGMGVIFALLIEATDSILSSMIVHFVINGTSVLGTYYLPKALESLEKATGQVQPQVSPTNLTTSDKIASIVFYSIVSIFTTTLAFIVYRNIAKNSGRYDKVVSIFTKKTRHTVKAASDVNTEYSKLSNNLSDANYVYDEKDRTKEVDPYEKNQVFNKIIISLPLIMGILYCLFVMVINELPIK